MLSKNLISYLLACRLITAAFVAVALGSALPQASFAASYAGLWKVEKARSNPNSTATITISRAKAGGGSATDKFLAITDTGVYVVSRASAANSGSLKPADLSQMMETSVAVLIGTQPRSNEPCGFDCRSGLTERKLTLTFNVVKDGEKQMNEM